MRYGVVIAVAILEDAMETMTEEDAMELEGVADYLKGEDFSERVRVVKQSSNFSHRWRRGFLAANAPTDAKLSAKEFCSICAGPMEFGSGKLLCRRCL